MPEGEPYTLSPEALQKLQSHDWPGNIRELENVIQRTLCFTAPGILNADDLQIDTGMGPAANTPSTTNGGIALSADTYNEFREKQMDEEREFLKAKILECNGSISLAADKLGMVRTALYNRLARLGLNAKDIR